MTISIYHVTFKHSGTANTLLQTVHVPNWVERVILRKKRFKVNYIGHKKEWFIHHTNTPVKKRLAKQFERMEAYWQPIAKRKKQRILKFR